MASQKQRLAVAEKQQRVDARGPYLIAGAYGFSNGVKHWQYGANVPADAADPAKIEELVGIGKLRRSMTPGRDVEPKVRPQSSAQAVVAPPDEDEISAIVKFAERAHEDLDEVGKHVVLAVRARLHPEEYRAGALIEGSQHGSAFLKRWLRHDAERTARRDGLAARRPVRNFMAVMEELCRASCAI